MVFLAALLTWNIVTTECTGVPLWTPIDRYEARTAMRYIDHVALVDGVWVDVYNTFTWGPVHTVPYFNCGPSTCSATVNEAWDPQPGPGVVVIVYEITAIDTIDVSDCGMGVQP